LIQHGNINIGVAVAIEGGLLTIVIRDADIKPLRVISQEVKELAARVRSGKVRSEDIEGSTFSISNLGMFDVEEFSAIINPPEVAILAVSSAIKEPIVEDDEVKISWRMKITLSADHRATDGVEAAKFMKALCFQLENPLRLLL
jgi:pyruvate dehydrogenase E2 component (dihydrolipoamide acetyltransferase)